MAGNKSGKKEYKKKQGIGALVKMVLLLFESKEQAAKMKSKKCHEADCKDFCYYVHYSLIICFAMPFANKNLIF